jgi:tripartite-type tricarboxylate transporter receptor subunit TctC
MTTSWGVMALNPAVPARTVPEFVAYAKANPGKINFGSSGMATITHLFGEMLSPIAAARRRPTACWRARSRCSSTRPACRT